MSEQTIIYMISSNNTDKIYIGSTIKSLNQRLSKHKSQYQLFLNDKYHWVTSFDVIKEGNCKIRKIVSWIPRNKKEVCEIEGKFIKSFKLIFGNRCVNKRIENQTMKQYYEANKDKLSEQKKQKFQCECGGYYTKVHKARHFKSQKHQEYLNN